MTGAQITIADVAARAGVSKTTVSRVLNDKDEVDAITAARVREVIDALGYVPSARAVGLARGRTQIVGMLVPSLTWPWINDVLQGAADVLESESYGLLLFACNRGDDSMRQFATQVSAKSFDGLIVVLPEGTIDRIADLYRRGLPVVMIDDRGNRTQFVSVATTNRAGAASAARHLIGLGRRLPLIITGHRHFGCTEARVEGFVEAYEEDGSPVKPSRIISGDFTLEAGRRAVQQALAAGIDFDAVFAHNDISAFGAMQALSEAGLRVPTDIAVIGFDDIPLAKHTDPPLTTVRQPLRQMGAAAAHLLLDQLAGAPMSEQTHVLPTELIVRGTTPVRG